jgi:chromosome segregation ATPase
MNMLDEKIIAAFAALVTAAGGFMAIILKPRHEDVQKAQEDSVAVTNITRDRERLDALIETVSLMQERLDEMRQRIQDIEVERDSLQLQVNQLREDLKTERVGHEKTKELLREKEQQLIVLNQQITDLQQQIEQLNRRQTAAGAVLSK